jgi:hypothetical protein
MCALAGWVTGYAHYIASQRNAAGQVTVQLRGTGGPWVGAIVDACSAGTQEDVDTLRGH